MDLRWLVEAVVTPVVAAVVGLAATVAAPLLTKAGVGYLRRRWQLDLDAREQAQLEQLATESVYAVEASLKGSGRSRE